MFVSKKRYLALEKQANKQEVLIKELQEQEELAKISQMVSLLNNEIGNAQIPEPIKLELFKEVEKFKRAVQFYVIRGAKGLKESANGLLGTVISSNETLNRIEDKHLLFKIGQLIRKMNSVSSTALKVKSIDAKINVLLPKIDPNKPFARRKK